MLKKHNKLAISTFILTFMTLNKIVMKKILIITLVSGLILGCGDTTNDSKTESNYNSENQIENTNVNSGILANTTATFGIEGMTCAHGCAATIEKKLAELSGVKSAVVDFDTKIATINYNSNDVDDAEMVNLVETMSNNQYKVADLKIETKEEKHTTEHSGSEETGNILSVPSFEMPNIIEFFTNII